MNSSFHNSSSSQREKCKYFSFNFGYLHILLFTRLGKKKDVVVCIEEKKQHLLDFKEKIIRLKEKEKGKDDIKKGSDSYFENRNLGKKENINIHTIDFHKSERFNLWLKSVECDV